MHRSDLRDPNVAKSLIMLLAGLSDASTRAGAAVEVARWTGAEELLIFIEDPEVGALLPAKGFPQTLSGGVKWRAFVDECSTAATGKVLAGELMVHGAKTSSSARGSRADDGSVLVVLDGSPSDERIIKVTELLPLVAAGLRAEQVAALAEIHANLDRTSARESLAIAQALDVARRELDDQRGRLIDALRAKDDFLAMLGHELRNPLAPILSAIDLIRLRSAGAITKEHGVIERQVRHMVRLVDDLMDVSRIARGTIELKRSRIDLADVVAGSIEMTTPLFRQRSHEVILSVEKDLFVYADEVRLAQLITNLLTNAAKYSEPGRTITVVGAKERGRALLSVRDEGWGIEASDIARVFDRFVQGKQELDRRQGGLGLGLTIAQTLAVLHGGEIRAFSEGRGRGSEFIVTLPIAQSLPNETSRYQAPD